MMRCGRIHSATWDRVCSITGMMPTTSVNNDAARDRVPKSAAMASTKASVLSSSRARSRSMRLRRTSALGSPSATNDLPLAVHDGAQFDAVSLDGFDVLVGSAHPPIVVIFGKPDG
jgi:hypothetical protein